MATVSTVGTTLVRIGLAAAFIGLGAFGVVLIAMALSLPGAIAKRVAVVVLGLGAITIAAGYVKTVRTQSRG